jgi:hypothetical protein
MTNDVGSYPVSGKELKRIPPREPIVGDNFMIALISGFTNNFVLTAVEKI